MKGEAVEQIPPLATLGRDDRKPAGCGRDDMVAALGRDDRDGRSFGSGLRPTLRMTEATAHDDRGRTGRDGKIEGEVRTSEPALIMND